MTGTVHVILLDFDGVLIESLDGKMRAYDDVFDRYPAHRDAMARVRAAHPGESRLDVFARIARDVLDVDEPGSTVLATLLAQFSEAAVKRASACPEVEGARAFLESFSALVPLYLSSLTPQDELRAIVEVRGLTRYLAGAFGNPPFTKAQAIAEALAREGADPAEMLLVGDSPTDADVARTMGVMFVGRDSGLGLPSTTAPCGADMWEVAEMVRPLVTVSVLPRKAAR